MSSCVCLINLCILVPACSVCVVWSTHYSRCFLSVSLALSSPDVIKDYYLSLRPSLRVPVSSSSVHRDRRPDLNSKRRPFTLVLFSVFEKSFVLVPVFVRPTGRHSSFCPSPRQVGVGVRRDRRECRESAGREPSCPPIAGDIRCRLWLSQARRLVV